MDKPIHCKFIYGLVNGATGQSACFTETKRDNTKILHWSKTWIF